jgi:hypothetical protein
MTPREFDQIARSLVGETIEAVIYTEVAYEEGGPAWNEESPHFDSLDHGLDLHLGSGHICSVTWGSEFANHGLSFSSTPLESWDRCASWPATQRWSHLVSTRITDVRLYWTYWENQDTGKRRYFPQDLEIQFENGNSVTLSAFESRRSQDFAMIGMDHITVFFRAEDLKRFNLGKYSSGVATSEVPWRES